MEFNNVIEIEIVQDVEETVNKSAVLIENGVSIVKKLVCWTGKQDKAQLAIDESANELFMELMKEVYPILVDKVRKNVEAWKKVAEGMDAGNFAIMGDPVKKCQVKWNNQLGKCKTYATLISQTGVGAEVLKEKPSFYDAMQMIIGNAVNIHPEYVGYSLDDKQMPQKLDITTSTKKEKDLLAGKSKVSTLSKEDEEAMDRDMDMTSDTDIRNKLNSCEEDEKTADIPRRKRKRTNNRASNAENLLALMRESEKKRVEEKKLKEAKKQQHHDEKMIVQHDLVNILRSLVVPVIVPPLSKRSKKGKEKKKSKREKRQETSDDESSSSGGETD